VKEHPVITESEPVPVFGRDGVPCPACSAPLAGDQRYCLHCGARRPEARLEFLDVLDADVQARSGALATGGAGYAAATGGWGAGGPPPGTYGWSAEPPRGFNARLQANAGLLALGALLLLMLLVGLLVGHWATGASSPTSAATPAPQVITVTGGAPAAAASATTGATSTTGRSGTGTSGKSSSSKSTSKNTSSKATAPKDSVSVKSLSSKKAVDDAVKKGKPISTGTGKLPPKDDKPAAGGTGFEDIG
jgi:hypothetical protein